MFTTRMDLNRPSAKNSLSTPAPSNPAIGPAVKTLSSDRKDQVTGLQCGVEPTGCVGGSLVGSAGFLHLGSMRSQRRDVLMELGVYGEDRDDRS